MIQPEFKIAVLVDERHRERAVVEHWAGRLQRVFGGSISRVETQALAESGAPVRRLKAWLHEEGIDLLVCDRSSIGEGSVTEIPVSELAGRDIPMLAVCPDGASGADVDPASPIERILVPSDLSEQSLAALNDVKTVFEAFGSDVLAYLVAPGVEVSPAVERQAARQALAGRPSPAATFITELHDMAEWCMENSVKQEVGEDTTVSARVENGEPANEIIRKAVEIDADLVIIASHGAGDSSDRSAGRVATEVISGAPCCVLCVNARPASTGEEV